MPTRHARISVVRDGALDEALRSVQDKLQAGSEAARLRELALIGASVLRGEDGQRITMREKLRDRHGARLSTGDVLLASRAARRAEVTAVNAHESVSASLSWARGDR